MSRCFPFPPPGYEKKARTDEVDLLNKEKQKEKHKKEKKEKEKREKKEKKEKDRSDGKHKDKKDKKEKHKDKEKSKDRDKEKEKDRSKNSEEKKFPGHPDGQNGEKTSDEKKFPRQSEGHIGEKFVQKDKGRDKDRSSFFGEKKLTGHFSGYNGEKIGQNSHPAEDSRDSKFVQELERRVRDEGAGAGNQLADKFMGTERKRDEGMGGFVAKTANKLAEEKERNKRSGDRKLDVQGIREETRSGGNAMVQILGRAVKARVDGIPRQVENNSQRQGEGKEKTKEKENDDKTRDKRKDKDREKKSHRKDKDRDKEKEEKAMAKGEHRSLELDNLTRSNKDDPVVTINLKKSHPSEDGNKGAVAEENFRKRKDMEKNGYFHVNDIKPNKLPRNSSSQLLMDNGRTLESCHAPIPLTLGSQGAGSSLKVDNKECKVNGIIEAQLSSVSPTKRLSSSAQASRIDEVSIKPPHPDSKYLSQVLSVPEMEEWPDFDDQSWLFHGNESRSKNPEVGFFEIDKAPQVWAEAVQIESADVCALPEYFYTTDCQSGLSWHWQRSLALSCHSAAGSGVSGFASLYQTTNSFKAHDAMKNNRMAGALK